MFDDISLCKKQGESATLGAKDLLSLYALFLLNFIPLVGPALYVTATVQVATKDGVAPSIRGYLQAALVWYFLFITFAIIYVL